MNQSEKCVALKTELKTRLVSSIAEIESQIKAAQHGEEASEEYNYFEEKNGYKSIIDKWNSELAGIKAKWENDHKRIVESQDRQKRKLEEISQLGANADGDIKGVVFNKTKGNKKPKGKKFEQYTVSDLIKVVKKHSTKSKGSAGTAQAKNAGTSKTEQEVTARIKLIQVAFLMRMVEICQKSDQEEEQKTRVLQKSLIKAQSRFNR